ncbi:MAG: hypothetical protein H0T84_06215 [Tatlockia sp.]|nr:hypothetical protein [Tatlockia sp.]
MSKIAIYLHFNADAFSLFNYNGGDEMVRINCYNQEPEPILSKFISARSKEAVLEALNDLQTLKPKIQHNPDFKSYYNADDYYYIKQNPTYILKGSDTELEFSFLFNTGVGKARYLSVEHMISLVKTKQRPILPFFRALNPASTYSGINNLRRENKEVLDTTVSEQIKKDFHSKHDFLDALCATFDILLGNHYKIRDQGFNSIFDFMLGSDKKAQENTNFSEEFSGKGSKGLLDYLIFPLLSRKLFWDSQHKGKCIQALTLLAVVPLEILRFSAGICLFLLLAIPVSLVQFAKSYLMNEEELESPEPDDCCFVLNYRPF